MTTLGKSFIIHFKIGDYYAYEIFIWLGIVINPIHYVNYNGIGVNYVEKVLWDWAQVPVAYNFLGL